MSEPSQVNPNPPRKQNNDFSIASLPPSLLLPFFLTNFHPNLWDLFCLLSGLPFIGFAFIPLCALGKLLGKLFTGASSPLLDQYYNSPNSVWVHVGEVDANDGDPNGNDADKIAYDLSVWCDRRSTAGIPLPPYFVDVYASSSVSDPNDSWPGAPSGSIFINSSSYTSSGNVDNVCNMPQYKVPAESTIWVKDYGSFGINAASYTGNTDAFALVFATECVYTIQPKNAVIYPDDVDARFGDIYNIEVNDGPFTDNDIKGLLLLKGLPTDLLNEYKQFVVNNVGRMKRV